MNEAGLKLMRERRAGVSVWLVKSSGPMENDDCFLPTESCGSERVSAVTMFHVRMFRQN